MAVHDVNFVPMILRSLSDESSSRSNNIGYDEVSVAAPPASSVSDVLEWQKLLSVDLAVEPHLLWVIQQAIETPMPPNYVLQYQGTGEAESANIGEIDDNEEVQTSWYIDTITGEQTRHPGLAFFLHLVEDERARFKGNERRKVKKGVEPMDHNSSSYSASAAVIDSLEENEGAEHWITLRETDQTEVYYNIAQQQVHRKRPQGVRPRPLAPSSECIPFYPSGLSGGTQHGEEEEWGSVGASGPEEKSPTLVSASVVGYGVLSKPQRNALKRRRPLPTTLEFVTWWTEVNSSGDSDQPSSSTSGSQRREAMIYFNPITKGFKVTLQGIAEPFGLSHIAGKFGPISAHDLRIGGSLNLFGRRVALQHASHETQEWLESEEAFLKWTKDSLLAALGKYGIQSRRMAALTPPVVQIGRSSSGGSGNGKGRTDLRKLLLEISQLREALLTVAPSEEVLELCRFI